jgi:hypothetical protein
MIATPFPQMWLTDEIPARAMIAKGRSAIDPDVLVAYVEGDARPLWIVDNGTGTEGCYVCGLGGDVRARLLNMTEPRPPALLPSGRHDSHEGLTDDRRR